MDNPTKRGQAGNSVEAILCSLIQDLIYMNNSRTKYYLSAGMRNAKLDTFDIGTGDSDFLDCFDNSEEIVDAIIDAYNTLPNERESNSEDEKQIKSGRNIEQRK
jgi:hypothetical protein